MNWFWAALITYVLAIGYLIWRGTGSLLRAVTGGVLLPVVGVAVLVLLLPRDAVDDLGVWFFVLSVVLVGYLIWQQRST